MKHRRHSKWRGFFWSILGLIVLMCGVAAERRYIGPIPLHLGTSPDAPAPLTTWPWPDAGHETTALGVTHWLAQNAPDGTVLDLFDFDFGTNPKLRFAMYDQDEDDAVPFDNKAHPWALSVAQATQHLNTTGRGPVLVACNGLFYDFDKAGPDATASHVTPVVLNGQVHYPQIENHRCMFGVKYDAQGRPQFRTIHMPPVNTLPAQFDYAAGGAQCLVLDGKPQALPTPSVGNSKHPAFAYMKTSRISWAWSRDNRHLYLLFVKEPDEEVVSEWAYAHHLSVGGGWSLPDEQRFWQSLGVWTAINSDAGDVAQLVYRLPGGCYELTRRYEMSEPRWSSASTRRILPPNLSDAPPGGSLMYWYVRDTQR